ncbi:MAG: thymidine kinase [Gammaproteobacteria bacterium]|nr:thymidine kinase [Gammaproteobacteria bacterium]
MAKLYFYYSTMNAGKSTALLQAAYNYKERGMDVLLFTPAIDTRYQLGHIHSRIGLYAEAIPFTDHFNFYDYVSAQKQLNFKIKCVLIDESQFLSKEQVSQLTDIVDILDLPVLAYGLRSDFQGEPFIGSLYLLILADTISEIKTVCHCGKKAIVNARIDEKGLILRAGKQIQIGGNESYIALCRKHFKNSSAE